MQLLTLGTLSLQGASLKRQQPLLLLAYLALEGRTSRRELTEKFFLQARSPRDSLSTALRHLRREIGGGLTADRDSIAASVPTDAVELIARADASAHHDVVRLYGGRFVDGLALRLDYELEAWVFGIREALARHARTAHIQLARIAHTEGHAREAQGELVNALRVPDGPELSETDIGLMLPLLDLVPAPDSNEVRRLANEYGFAAQPPRHLRDRVRIAESQRLDRGSTFIGRIRELEALEEIFVRDDARLVTVYGMGGIGKTRIGMRFAERQHESGAFPNGVYVVPLENLDESQGVIPAIAATLGLPSGFA